MCWKRYIYLIFVLKHSGNIHFTGAIAIAISAVVEVANDVDLWVDLLVELDGGTARAAEHRAAVLHHGALQHRDDDGVDCEDDDDNDDDDDEDKHCAAVLHHEENGHLHGW